MTKWSYKKIIPIVLIEFIQNLGDENGNKIDLVKLGVLPDSPADIRTVVTIPGNRK